MGKKAIFFQKDDHKMHFSPSMENADHRSLYFQDFAQIRDVTEKKYLLFRYVKGRFSLCLWLKEYFMD